MAKFLSFNKSNCKNCYKCIRSCPVKSIRFSANQAHIIEDDCILCGKCFVVCPQDVKEIVSELEKVKVLIQSGVPVVASVAPSFIANYNGTDFEELRKSLKEVGFYDAEETSIGATFVKREYDRLLNEGFDDILISSACHSVNLLIQKYFPNSLKYLAKVMSPMQAHATDIKKRIPNAKVVFIGPCVAKKDEADRYQGIVDAVLTFEEVSKWFKGENVTVTETKACNNEDTGKARFFPTTGGILKTMDCEAKDYSYIAVDGAENCIAVLKDIEAGKIHKCFIEMSTCAGSCIGGPVIKKYHESSIRDYLLVSNYAGSKDFDVEQLEGKYYTKFFAPIDRNNNMPSDYEIMQIMRQMGKIRKSDELNCSCCGYNTCRDKAIAIYQGKAEISMCLPFLKEKAESFSDCIVSNTPNGIVVLNDSFEVQQINAAAMKIMNIRNESDVLGDQVVRILDPTPFIKVNTTKQSIKNQKVYLAEYDKYISQSIIFDATYHLLVCIMRDVTEAEKDKRAKEELSRRTVETADKVVDKQMRIVQDIASLLGETAAETKIALTKLKETITNE